MKRIVFNLGFHGIGGLFWINVLVSTVWIFELDQSSKMLKFSESIKHAGEAEV